MAVSESFCCIADCGFSWQALHLVNLWRNSNQTLDIKKGKVTDGRPVTPLDKKELAIKSVMLPTQTGVF